MPGTDIRAHDTDFMYRGASASARVVSNVMSNSTWRHGTDSNIVDALLTYLPINAISALSMEGDTQLNKAIWLRHAQRLAMLNRVYLVSTALRAFRQMLAEDAPRKGPRLPRLTKLILSMYEHVVLLNLQFNCLQGSCVMYKFLPKRWQ